MRTSNEMIPKVPATPAGHSVRGLCGSRLGQGTNSSLFLQPRKKAAGTRFTDGASGVEKRLDIMLRLKEKLRSHRDGCSPR